MSSLSETIGTHTAIASIRGRKMVSKKPEEMHAVHEITALLRIARLSLLLLGVMESNTTEPLKPPVFLKRDVVSDMDEYNA